MQTKLKKEPFWKKKWDGKICGITRGRLRPGKNRYGLTHVVFLNCTHGFYRNALVEWVRNCPTETPTCPMCRQGFEIGEILY